MYYRWMAVYLTSYSDCLTGFNILFDQFSTTTTTTKTQHRERERMCIVFLSVCVVDGEGNRVFASRALAVPCRSYLQMAVYLTSYSARWTSFDAPLSLPLKTV